MPKQKPEKSPDPDDPVMERMNEALKKMMDTPPETQKEMIKRRRQGKDTAQPRKKAADLP